MRDAATVGHTEWKRENDAPKKVARGRACGRCAKPLAETRRTGVRFLSYRTWFWSASWSWNMMEHYFLVLRTRKIHPKFRTANRIIVSINRGMIRDQKEIRLMNVLNKCALLSSIKCRGELWGVIQCKILIANYSQHSFTKISMSIKVDDSYSQKRFFKNIPKLAFLFCPLAS